MKHIPVLLFENNNFNSANDLSTYTGDELSTQHITVKCKSEVLETNKITLLINACNYVNKFIDKNITTHGVIAKSHSYTNKKDQICIEEITFQVVLE